MKFLAWQLLVLSGSIICIICGVALVSNPADYSGLQASFQANDWATMEIDYPLGTPLPEQPPPMYQPISLVSHEEYGVLIESTKININTCTVEQLSTVKGIGPRTAEDIINNRPYHTLKQLRSVKGIGEKTFAKIAPFLTVGKPEEFTAEIKEPEPAAKKKSDRTPSSKSKKSTSALTGKINLNTASSEELQKLPRIGPKAAERIISYREANGPFQHLEDLMNVKGIGEKTFEQLKDLITL